MITATPLENTEMLWETKDGIVISVVEMTDRHLQNAIAYMERRLSAMIEEQKTIWSCLSMLHGEAAQDAAESAADQIREKISDANFAIHELKAEMVRRSTVSNRLKQ